MSFENALRRALQRTDAPEGFSERVMARVQPKRRASSRLWFAIAAAAAIAVVVPAGWQHQQATRMAEERKAGQQLAEALRITGEKLYSAEQRIRRRTNGV